MISKDDYRDWKNHPVTEVFFKELKEITEAIERSHFDGANISDHAEMAQNVGLVRAYRSVLEYKPNFDDEGCMIDDNGDIVE